MRHALLLLLGLLLGLTPIAADAKPPAPVLRVQIEGDAITPVTARFVSRAVREAKEIGAQYLLIELDTPGGLVDSTRTIVHELLSSGVKVVVYVAPSGARAASAGLFITLAANVAAMAPGTHIGAAHPVQIGGLPTQPPEDEKTKGSNPMSEKIANDTQAWARSLAQLRGRNAEVAERAVSESLSLTNSEAVEKKLVDFTAKDLKSLLARLDGAKGAPVKTLEMGLGQRILVALANPNVAFLLLMLGFYGMLFEFYTAGFGVAGTLGGICLLLGAVGLAILPLSYAGLALLGVGLALFVAEVFVTSFGLLTVGGVVCVILGGLMLVDSPTGFLRVSSYLVIPVALATALVTLFLLGSVVKAHRARIRTGTESLLSEPAVAAEAFTKNNGNYMGAVFVHGERWKAKSTEPVAEHEPVEVERRDGLTLTVAPRSKQPGEAT